MRTSIDSRVLQALNQVEDVPPNFDTIDPPLDPKELAEALWTLVCEGHGPLVARFRPVLARMQTDGISAADFMLLLEGLASANPSWLHVEGEVNDGLGYPGWSFELERLLRRTLRSSGAGSLAECCVREPLASSLLFSLGRHGVRLERCAHAQVALCVSTGHRRDPQEQRSRKAARRPARTPRAPSHPRDRHDRSVQPGGRSRFLPPRASARRRKAPHMRDRRRARRAFLI